MFIGKLPKVEIESIAKTILSESDIIAKHGTSIDNGLSIISTGFNYHRTSYVIDTGNSIEGLCTYGWKDNKIDDSANVIISIPRTFMMEVFNLNEEEYDSFIRNVKYKELESDIIDSLCDCERNGFFTQMKLPREFIRGMFIFTDHKTYKDFLDNPEDGLMHLAFYNNPNYFKNLNKEEQKAFVEHMKEKMFPKEKNKAL